MPLPCRQPAVTRSSLWRTLGCLLLALVALAGCARDPAPPPPPPQLRTVQRLLDRGLIVGEDRRLERGSYKFLASEARPVLTSARSFTPALTCEDAPRNVPRPCSAGLPADMPAAPHTILQRDSGAAQPAHHDDPAPDAASSPAPEQSLPLGDAVHGLMLLPAEGSVALGSLSWTQIIVLRAYPVPSLAERALAAEPFVVPPEALLRLSIGIEEAAWWIDSAPVLFRVVLEDEKGGSQDMMRRVLDPARRPQDRRWFDADVDLSDLAGRKVHLRFVTEPAQSGDTRPSLPLWGDPRVLAPRGAKLPSIVLVSLDTQRAQSMSTYGHRLDTSPFASALAARGALFESAFTTFSNTLPSHMSMLTGLYPATHGVLGLHDVLGGEHRLLAELARDAGYTTGAFTEDALLDSRRGFRRGFSTYYENTGIEHGAGDAKGTFGRALEWAGRNADTPLFLFVHTYQVHFPYEPPAAYQQLFRDGDGARLAAPQRAYEQEIRYLDDLLRRLVEGLRKVVPDDDLILVVTADHGEEFGEHGAMLHTQLYDEVMHVPLVVVWADHVAAGQRIAAPVSLVDVAPTILALAGLHAPPRLDGVSLVPLLTGGELTPAREAVLGEYPRSAFAREARFVARSADAKCFLAAAGKDAFCFDLRADPGESSPRPTEETAAFARLYRLGDAYRVRALAARDAARRTRKHGGSGADRNAAAPPDAARESAGPIEQKLRALGYIQ